MTFATTVPPELLPWLPGPVATVEHTSKAVSRTTRRLRKLAAGRRLHVPETWKAVAKGLGIGVTPFFDPGGSRARLAYDEDTDGWIIYLNVAYSLIQQASALVHELAHFFFHEARGEWLCDEPVVYFYEGAVGEEHHKLARDVDQAIVQIWEEVPKGAGGLFDIEPDAQTEGDIFFE